MAVAVTPVGVPNVETELLMALRAPVHGASTGVTAVDQCVAFVGCSSSVLTITRSTSSSLIVRGFPGRGSSCKPSRRS